MKTRITKAELTAENSELRARLAALSFALSLRPFSRIAWTGGSRRRKPSEVGQIETATRRAMFREQVNTWRNYWKDLPPFDVLRTYYVRAAADAHATFRDALNS